MLTELLNNNVINVIKQKKHILPLLKDSLIVKLETGNECAYLHINKTAIDIRPHVNDVEVDVHIISDTLDDILHFMNGEVSLKEVKKCESIRMIGKLKYILRLESIVYCSAAAFNKKCRII